MSQNPPPTSWAETLRRRLWAWRARGALRSGTVDAWAVAEKEPQALAWAVQRETEANARGWMGGRATQTALWLLREEDDARALFSLARETGSLWFESAESALAAERDASAAGSAEERAELMSAQWLPTARVLKGRWGARIGVYAREPAWADWRAQPGEAGLALRESTWRRLLEDGAGLAWERSQGLANALRAATRADAKSGQDEISAIAQQAADWAATAGGKKTGPLGDPGAPEAAAISALRLMGDAARWLASEGKWAQCSKLACAARFAVEARRPSGSSWGEPRGAEQARVEQARAERFATKAAIAAFGLASDPMDRAQLLAGWKACQPAFLWGAPAGAKSSEPDQKEASERFLWDCAKQAWGAEDAAQAWSAIAGSAAMDALVERDALASVIQRAGDASRGKERHDLAPEKTRLPNGSASGPLISKKEGPSQGQPAALAGATGGDYALNGSQGAQQDANPETGANTETLAQKKPRKARRI